MKVKYLAFYLIFLLISSQNLSAEIIYLKSGNKIEGKIIERTDEYIRIDFYGIALTYYFDEIKEIEGESRIEIVNTEKAIEIINEKTKKYSRHLSNPEIISEYSLRNFVLQLREYLYNLPQDILPPCEDVLTNIKNIAITNGILEAKDWPLDDLVNFLSQINNYFRKYGLFFGIGPDVSFKGIDFFLANIEKVEEKEINLPSPWNRKINFTRLLLKNHYFLYPSPTRLAFTLRLMPDNTNTKPHTLVGHNLDAYYNEAVNRFFIFYFLELRGIDIKRKDFLTEDDIFIIFETKDLSKQAILYLKLVYKAWRDEYIDSLKRFNKESEQIEYFAKIYTDINITCADYHECIHIIQSPPKKDNPEEYELEAIFGELILSPYPFKKLARYITVFLSPVSDYHGKAYIKLFTTLALYYQEFLKEKDKKTTCDLSQEPDLISCLEGIDELGEEDLKILFNRMKEKFL